LESAVFFAVANRSPDEHHADDDERDGQEDNKDDRGELIHITTVARAALDECDAAAA
jgi:hypothetical protein